MLTDIPGEVYDCRHNLSTGAELGELRTTGSDQL